MFARLLDFGQNKDHAVCSITICVIHILLGMDQVRVYLYLEPKARLKVSDLVASAWRIDTTKYVTIVLTFGGFYKDTLTPPVIDAYQSGTVGKHTNMLDGKIKFGLYWTVEQRLRQDV